MSNSQLVRIERAIDGGSIFFVVLGVALAAATIVLGA
jgi:hypothetical protein